MSTEFPATRSVVSACPACQAIADRLVALAASFGHLVATGHAVSPGLHVCVAHLPLVVDVTAPRELAAWLRASLVAGRVAPEWPSPECRFCTVETEAAAEVRSRSWSYGMACEEHANAALDSVEALLPTLGRLAAGERLPLRDEVTALRAALVRYASSRGTRAFVLRIE